MRLDITGYISHNGGPDPAKDTALRRIVERYATDVFWAWRTCRMYTNDGTRAWQALVNAGLTVTQVPEHTQWVWR